MRGLILSLALLCASCGATGGALAGGTANVGDIVHPADNTAPFVYDGHVKDFGFWLDSSKATQAFTTFVHIYIDLDADPAEWASLFDPNETRKYVVSLSPFYYTKTVRSLNGYVYRDDFQQKWTQIQTLIAGHLGNILALWCCDEPDAVACGDQLDTDHKPCGTVGDVDWNPNLYNPDITRWAQIVHASFPTLAVGYNLSGGSNLARVADGVDVIGIELYDDDWQAKLQYLETITPAKVFGLTRSFAQGDPSVLDAPSAARLQTQWTWFQHDTRVVAIFPFLWCCDDRTTGSKDFYAVSGGKLPLTLQAQKDISAAVLK